MASIHVQQPGDKLLLTQTFNQQQSQSGLDIRIQEAPKRADGTPQTTQPHIHQPQLQPNPTPAPGPADLSKADYNYLVNKTKIFDDTNETGFGLDGLDEMDGGVGPEHVEEPPNLFQDRFQDQFQDQFDNQFDNQFQDNQFQAQAQAQAQSKHSEDDADHYNPRSDQVRREKGFLLSQYQSKNKEFRYSAKRLTMDNSIDEIRNELGYINSKKEMENNLWFWKRAVVLSADGLVRLNNTYDPFDVDMSDWSKQIHYDVMETGNYNEVLEKLVQKYRSSFALPPEVKLLTMMGMSFGMALMSKRHEKELLRRLQADCQRQEERIRAEVANQLQEQFRQMGPSSYQTAIPKGPTVSLEDVFNKHQNTNIVADLMASDLDSVSSGGGDKENQDQDQDQDQDQHQHQHQQHQQHQEPQEPQHQVEQDDHQDNGEPEKKPPKKKGRPRAAAGTSKAAKKKTICQKSGIA
ncbi:hypothetical protein HK102_003964 [Quaeritorhiza haematococci]|nr:hypothetical protein HK102_003964 [Quaeritorhiza haematococci]